MDKTINKVDLISITRIILSTSQNLDLVFAKEQFNSLMSAFDNYKKNNGDKIFKSYLVPTTSSPEPREFIIDLSYVVGIYIFMIEQV